MTSLLKALPQPIVLKAVWTNEIEASKSKGGKTLASHPAELLQSGCSDRCRRRGSKRGGGKEKLAAVPFMLKAEFTEVRVSSAVCVVEYSQARVL